VDGAFRMKHHYYSGLLVASLFISPNKSYAQIDNGLDGTVTVSQDGVLFTVVKAKSFSCFLNTEESLWNSDEKKWDVIGVFDQISLTQINPYYFSAFKSAVNMSFTGNFSDKLAYVVQYDLGRFAQNRLHYYNVKTEKRTHYLFAFQKNEIGSVLKLTDGKIVGSGECKFKNLPFVDPRPLK
jgi:hypothetical protein